MDFRTKIDIPKQNFEIDYNSKILLLGSCFTTQIGEILQDYKFNTVANPFGVLYNPYSIRNSIELLTTNKEFTTKDIIQTNPTDKISQEKYASFFHHSSFARLSKEEFLENANEHLRKASQFLKAADTVIITLGTSWIYKLTENSMVVSNCHKRLSSEFTRERMTTSQVKQALENIINMLPDKKIIFTVSPIRHFKDGAHQNMLSKSTLLLAIDQVCQVVDRVDYFPAYEIVMDELRDYRFYAADMLHPSEVAIEYLWQRFREWCFSADANRATDEALRLRSRLNHRFLTADTAAQQAFRAQTDKLLAEFLSRHPYLRP
jgi:hypothetical protein